MNNKTAIGTIIVLILVVIAGYLGYKIYKQNSTSTNGEPTQEISTSINMPNSNEGSTSANATSSGNKNASQHVIEITVDGFSPSQITIKAGETVIWINKDSSNHQVNSDNHPTHLLYPPLNTIGLLLPGQQKSLTFPDKGSFGFHDHLNPSNTGTVIVE